MYYKVGISFQTAGTVRENENTRSPGKQRFHELASCHAHNVRVGFGARV